MYVPPWKIHKYINCYTKAVRRDKFVYIALFRERAIHSDKTQHRKRYFKTKQIEWEERNTV